jgi:hypothetical protein
MIRKHRLGTLSYLPDPREGVKRLGKKRSHIFDRLDTAGGKLALQELGRMMGVRPRDLVRRKKTEKGRDGLLVWPAEAGILVIEGDVVSLTPDWLDRLEEERERGKELDADEQAKGKRKRRSLAYRDHLKRKRGKAPAPKPSTAGVANIRASRGKRRAYLDTHASDPAARTPTDAELAAMRRRVGRLVREGMARRFAEQEVYGAAASCTTRSDPPTGPPDDPMKHPLDCECLDCSARAPSYARAFGGAA